MNKLRKELLPVFTFAKIDIKRLFRDKTAIFFTIAFPMIFLFIFGGLFGGDNDINFKVGFVNQSDTQFSKDFEKQLRENKMFEIDPEINSIDGAQEKMKRSEVDATIVLPQGFGAVSDKGYPKGEAKILYNQNNEQVVQTLSSVLDSVFTGINEKLVPTDTPFTVKTESNNSRSLDQFDYTFAGLLGFSLLSLGIFGPANVFPRLKSKGVLRRYHTTSLKVWQYFTASALSTMAIGILSVGLMFIVGLLHFDIKMQGDYASLAIMVMLGAVTLFGIGLAIGGWAKNENQAAPLAQAVGLPLMFLSGTFFPRFLMPDWLQQITNFLPLTPVIDGIRLIITEGQTIFDLGTQIAMLAAWAIIVYIIAFRVFRWE